MLPLPSGARDGLEAVGGVEGAGALVPREDVQGEAGRAVPPHLAEEQGADALPQHLGPQVEVVEQIPVEDGVADDLPAAYRDPCAAPRQHQVPDPRGDLAVPAALRRQVRHGGRPRVHVDPGDVPGVLGGGRPYQDPAASRHAVVVRHARDRTGAGGARPGNYRRVRNADGLVRRWGSRWTRPAEITSAGYRNSSP
jgi:hypothetical protein